MADEGARIVINEDNTKDYLQQLSAGLARALEQIGMTAEGYAKAACPVDTGLLRNSITYQVAGGQINVSSATDNKGNGSITYNSNSNKGYASEKAVYVGSGVEYAEYVETNDRAHHKNGRAHFLRDSASKHLGEYEKIVRANLGG
jgi:hypothetical protein